MPAMTAPRVWKRGIVSLSAVLVVVMVAGTAQADVVFRKKPPAPTDNSGLEGSPSGGDSSATEGQPAGEATGEGAGAAKGTYIPQAEDKDFPEAQAIKEKKAADAALARQARAAQLSKERDQGEPIYKKWQFWAIAGGIVLGGALAIFAGSAVWHQMQGGDVRGCVPMSYPGGCFGEGR
jgi:hypothetical protein